MRRQRMRDSMVNRTSMRRGHRCCHRLEVLNSLKSRAATGGLSKTCESLARLDPKMGGFGLRVDHRNVHTSAVSGAISWRGLSSLERTCASFCQ